MAQNDEEHAHGHAEDSNTNPTWMSETYDRLEPNIESNAAYNEIDPKLTVSNPAYNRRDELDPSTETNPAYQCN